jgi:riboflavin synthase
MFTGLVQAIGQVHPIAGGLRVQCQGQQLAPLALGDSVAVDGVCLTVRKLTSDGFEADVSPETLSRTTLAQAGGWVNLEPALAVGNRLGGHFVSGHVDGLGVVRAIQSLGHSWRLELAWEDQSFDRYICDKGSITVNGISLTIAGTGAGASFWLAVIPVSWEQTTLKYIKIGDRVNLEADLLAKYVEKLLRSPASNAIDEHWLLQNGWTV